MSEGDSAFVIGGGARSFFEMARAARAFPQYSKARVDKSGAVLVDFTRLDTYDAYARINDALAVINNWRSSHSFPLNTFHVGLRRRASLIDPKVITSERIKRLASIESKLLRFRSQRLSQMQDIGGCRAVVQNIEMVADLTRSFLKSDLRHRLVGHDDYILAPKASGYRGVHLIYRYHSDKKTTYNGLNIEVQLRSQLQHAWATAVETVGTFIRQALKSSEGEEEWLRFFALMGTALALREGTNPVPNTPTKKKELVDEIRRAEKDLGIIAKLRGFQASLNEMTTGKSRGAHYFLLKLEPNKGLVTVTGFKRPQMEEAADAYLEAEKSIKEEKGSEAVLVSVDSIAALRRAYPNYFLDTDLFLDALRDTLSS